MNAPQLIQVCERRGIRLYQNGDNLRVGPASKITPALKAALLAHKPEILRLLPIRQTRLVFEYRLAYDPHARLIMLCYHGETLDEARVSLFDRFGSKVLSIEPYVWPPRPPCGGLH